MFDHKEEGQRIRKQTADGREIAIDLLNGLAIGCPRFSFKERSRGNEREEIIDSTGETVAVISAECLQDAPSTPERRITLKAHLAKAIRVYFAADSES